MRSIQIAGLVIGLTLVGTPAGAGTFYSGSTGANGPFPPPPIPGTYTEMQLDLTAGNVKYYNGATLVSTVAIPGGTGGFPTGVLNFTTITVPSGKTLKFLRNASNTPVTLLAQTTITINGTLSVDGQNGRPAVAAVSFDNAGGPGGPGGYDGGAGGNNVAALGGGQGLGPGGGSPQAPPPPATDCSGAGGSFATVGLPGNTGAGNCGTAGLTYGNPQLLPLVGGSGGAGGSSPTGVRTGGSGGGGGGAVLLAASTTLTLTGTISAKGGNGGTNSPSIQNGGGGGAGGAVRLVANTLTGSGGTIAVAGGSGMPGQTIGIGGLGRVRLEAYSNTLTVTLPGHPLQTAALVIPSVTSPGAVALASGPTLRIASIAGITAPTNPTGSYGTPDITVPATASSPVAVVVTATNIPNGTPVVLRATPITGTATTATTPGLSGGTASASLPVDLTQPGVVSAEATFQLAGWFDSPIKYAGEEVTTVTVTAGLGTGTGTGAGTGTHVRYFTATGKEVPAEAVAALGLPR